MTVLFLDQKTRAALNRVEQAPQRPFAVQVLDQGSMHLAVGRVIAFVKAWDPNAHPRGYKGMFIETPDKKNAGGVNRGDVIATKSGKVFQVTGHGAKGIKVQSVDPDSGEVLGKGTVVANGIEVAVLPAGTQGTTGTQAPAPNVQKYQMGQRVFHTDDLNDPDAWGGEVEDIRDDPRVPGKREYKVFWHDNKQSLWVPETLLVSENVYDAAHGKLLQKPGQPRGRTPLSQVVPRSGPPAPASHGASVAIGTLAPDTYIQHPRSNKRFVVSKQGNWTTVYPVNDQGERIGKHTVLPPTSVVRITSKEASGQVTPTTVETLNALPVPVASQPRGARRGNPLKKNQVEAGFILKGIKATQGVDVDEYYRVEDVTPDGSPIVIGGAFNTPTTVDPKLFTLERGHEKLPENLANPPRPYARGVGKGTAVVIREIPEINPSAYRSVGKSQFQVVRIPDASKPDDPGEVISTFAGIGQARKWARANSERHEAVLEQKRIPAKEFDYETLQPGQWIYHDGGIHQVQSVFKRPSHYYNSPPYYHIETQTPKSFGGGNVTINTGRETLPLPDSASMANVFSKHGEAMRGGHLSTEFGTGTFADDLLAEVKRQQGSDVTSLRAARANLFVPILMDDYDPSELVGGPRTEAVKVFKKLGYAEIEPKEKGFMKLVNARGQRIHVAHASNVVTSVDEIQYPSFVAAGDGAAGYHKQLQAVLDQGGDLRDLDPRNEGPEAANTITRVLLFDMAQGKQNGVEKLFRGTSGTIKVKSDAAYQQEIQAEINQTGGQHALARENFVNKIDDPGLNVPMREDVMDKHFPTWRTQTEISQSGSNLHVIKLDGNEGSAFASVALAAAERNGFAQWVSEQYAQQGGGVSFKEAVSMMAADYELYEQDPSDPDNTFNEWTPGQRDYILSTLKDVQPRGIRQWGLRETEVERRIDALHGQAVTDEITTRRKAEGTVATAPGSAATFELPLWDDVEFGDQDIGDVDALIQNAHNDQQQVPMFFSGGILKDGVAYGVKNSYREASTSQGTRPKATGKPRVDAEVPVTHDDDAVKKMEAAGAKRVQNTNFPHPHGHVNYRVQGGITLRVDYPGGKYVEYNPHLRKHGQSEDVSTNQRGRLIMEGFTAEEASQVLVDLGFVHQLEQQVPFESVMRSKRRYGRVLPLHSDYVSGKAPLPKIPSGISHGMSSGNMDAVFNSGALLPIAERFRLGIPLNGTIPLNDITAGVDHVVFASMQTSPGGAYGDMNVIYKDSAYLRRDILICDRIFNAAPGAGGRGRYPAYRQYHNERRKDAGIRGPEADVSPYAALEPKARQAHIDQRLRQARSASGLSTGNNEWDLAGGVPIEDMAHVTVSNASQETKLNALLDRMLREGRISERPTVSVYNYGEIKQLTR